MYNKEQCIKNIYALAKQEGIKIGDLEERSGVSRGYLSRINKEDYGASPSIEVLDSISRQLGVGLGFLVDFSPDELSPNEQFVFRLVDKLMTDTTTRKLEWLVETSALLNAKNDNKVENPLVFVESFYDGDKSYPYHDYKSGIYDGRADVTGNCYHAEIAIGATVYLNNVTYTVPDKDKSQELEMYLHHGVFDQSLQPICSTYYIADSLKKAIRDLYAAVDTSSVKIAFETSAKLELENYIKRPRKEEEITDE